jgi:hypothetical protein
MLVDAEWPYRENKRLTTMMRTDVLIASSEPAELRRRRALHVVLSARGIARAADRISPTDIHLIAGPSMPSSCARSCSFSISIWIA